MRFTIALFPKGRKQEKTPAIYFPDKETKETYITKEEIFCRSEYNEYLTSMPNAREMYQKALDDKRILFAKQQNYAAKKSDKFMWILQESTGGDEPKQYA